MFNINSKNLLDSSQCPNSLDTVWEGNSTAKGFILEKVPVIIDSKIRSHQIEQIQILVKSISGRTLKFTMTQQSSIGDLEELIEQETGISRNSQKLLLEGKSINGIGQVSRKISSLCLQNGSVLHLVLNLKGGGMDSFSFSGLKKPKEVDYISDAYDGCIWRTLIAGLNLEGICRNPSCYSQGDTVFVQMGMGTFDMDRVTCTSTCPRCHYHIDVSKPIFYTCLYSISGVLEDHDEHISKEDLSTPTDRAYLTYAGNIKQWKHLTITTKSSLDFTSRYTHKHTSSLTNCCHGIWRMPTQRYIISSIFVLGFSFVALSMYAWMRKM